MGYGEPSTVIEHERDSAKVNVFCAISSRKFYGPFSFSERSVTSNVYRDIIEVWLMPQLHSVSTDYIFQQDGAPPHWSTEVRSFLNQHLPKLWIGRSGDVDDVFCSWPLRSPDLTPCDFFLWGYVKDRVYVPPMPKTIEELKVCICNALASVTEQMLQNVWREMDYRLYVVRVTKGSHIEHL
ncbi:hypothetical protein AVEN_262966-1 [Araneus ventricosus]|uniref:Tc1-like transposase DDE domain-containing protein n=1 Tax=Araneus ventricosus TaxID=182803 RepID=A0A4Y2DHX9_ARAVE|nr:hypothetical protein AVEN_262966-1 [Araneus ventricosus]